MARYRHIDMSPRLLPVDLSAFDAHYRNDDNGAPAHAPTMLFKAALLAYSQGMVSSRSIARACRDNVLFIALTGDAKPHFTTLADFVSRSREAIAAVFSQVLTLLDDEGLIGREMFAIDGVKLPSNASKHRSGTRAEFLAQAQKMERAATTMLERHQANDAGAAEDVLEAKAAARVERLTREAAKIRQWLVENPDDRPGSRGNIRKSNRTDNESAKLATDRGVIQGYCGVAVVDAKHQVIVEASAHGTGAEQELLLPVLDACADQRTDTTLITADAGYHSEANLAAPADKRIDALMADNAMRRRDERFAEQNKHLAKPDPLHDKSGAPKKGRLFGRDDFIVAADQSHAICPAGQRLYRNGKDCTIGRYAAIKFRASDAACRGCPLRTKCLRKPQATRARQVAVLTRKTEETHSQRMRDRIDSAWGREQYRQRFATVEPIFGNVRGNKRLNRFTLRGQTKVDGQWKLFALVHNIGKWANYRRAT